MWIYKAFITATQSCPSFLSDSNRGVGRILLNVKQICVQRLHNGQSSNFHLISPSRVSLAFGDKVQVLPKHNFFYTKGTTKNGHFMLNVQFSRPFHAMFLTYCSNKFNQLNGMSSRSHRRIEILKVETVKIRNEGTFSIQNLKSEQLEKFYNAKSSQSNYHSVDNEDNENDEEDMEEVTKEAIWNVGPTPAASFTFAAYANDSDIIQKLVKLGVDLSRVERKYGTMPFLLKLDFEKDMAPTIRFLTDNGVDPSKLGWYFTTNPFLFGEDLINLEKRLDYLRLKNFTQENICRIINCNPFWLAFSVTRIDQRLGFFQSFFRLNGTQVRELVVSGPKLITSKLDRVKDVTFLVKEEMGFEPDELVKMLLDKPRIWREKPDSIRRRFDYLHNVVKFPHNAFVLCPELLLVRESRLKHRIGFLEHIGKAQFDPEKPNYVSFGMIYEGDDSTFAIKVAKSSVLEFNEYMKCL
ncbi:transcription termination factor 3, mitochondrial [Folsomia candida]|uniref:transcription termination factor 3, mitochondrial n=1 Tax=Folsomia candida TaxID=158441 RepID=UPI001605216A|nr:transcription termination factor 3, mitochondrial [Folsomia candida]